MFKDVGTVYIDDMPLMIVKTDGKTLIGVVKDTPMEFNSPEHLHASCIIFASQHLGSKKVTFKKS